MRLKIVQAGDPVLRQAARPLSKDEIKSTTIQELIEHMKATMYDAPGVGLAAPQIGESIQLAVIEDRPEYSKNLDPQVIKERERHPVPFQVIINPQITLEAGDERIFFEACLSVEGYTALVARARKVTIECLNEKAEPVTIKALGWHARILQHEIDHLMGMLYLDRMESRSFCTSANFSRFWADKPIASVCRQLSLCGP